MNKLLVVSLALLLPASGALAETLVRAGTDVRVGTEIRAESDDKGDSLEMEASSSMGTRSHSEGHATGTMEKDDADATSTDDEGDGNEGERMAASHRSVVATFVHSLLADADRDGGIGAQVRAVAQSQNDSASTTASAVVKVENRSRLLSFLFGTDWKTIGTLRSQIAKSKSDAAKLQEALNEATDAVVRTDLQTQLNVLQGEQAKVQTFVDAHASSFSLFGWFTKLFAGADAGKQ